MKNLSNVKINKKAAIITGCACATGLALYGAYKFFENIDDVDPSRVKYPKVTSLTQLDKRIQNLATQYEKDAAQLLRELISFPEDHLQADPLCGTSNHEKLRLEFLRQRIIDLGAVLNKSDVNFDDFGNLVWHVSDPQDPVPLNDRKVIYLDARSDTVPAQNDQWHTRLGSGIDAFQGMVDPATVNDDALRAELGFVPPRDRWQNVIFGRGSADQLQGIVSAVFATKILLETINLESLKGCVIIAIASVSGSENAGGSIFNRFNRQTLSQWQVPDCVILLQSTGDVDIGPCGIYIGQQGRCQIEVEVVGCTAQNGLNALEYGSLIIAEAENQAKKCFKKSKFMGYGTRTVISTKNEVSNDPNIPSRFTFRFDRRTTHGELWNELIKEIQLLKTVKRARDDGMQVNITIPRYRSKSWKGVIADNDLVYQSWLTPPENPVVMTAVEAYKRVVSPNLDLPKRLTNEEIPKIPRISRWISSSDGVGYLMPKDQYRFKIEKKNWISNGQSIFPPIFGIGAGYEQHSGKLGEYVSKEHLWVPISVAARFPSLFAQQEKV
ncbi:Clan MH, family M20, peptidase T-like metallopeptidase [Tritrichomonas foetus]|uniref:Clan MH, family M20, peptidase T-like metallopeptidase n=1 Tax=Tritrichomonas foetus TaxID=1144522 RepID=A0A1J4KU34_9EUKA|nr:Clan MH, family M20, peptidase T-like metallopeptidase [Tritrichomonas foetus]|eukprot:OHT14775.1 Clan MH, family M20, peptidase T-like metallopeptidase [Tritrichomonas foetus]